MLFALIFLKERAELPKRQIRGMQNWQAIGILKVRRKRNIRIAFDAKTVIFAKIYNFCDLVRGGSAVGF